MNRSEKYYESLVGKKFGRLTIIEAPELKQISPQKRSRWAKWKCDCGNIGGSIWYNIYGGKTLSCGCYFVERRAKANFRHGLSNHKLMFVWSSMIQRCHNKNDSSYIYYGSRGITVCKDWRNFKKFYDWAITAGWKEGLEIDREDNSKGYSPSNCRVVTKTKNLRNKRTSIIIEYNGEKKSLAEWAEIYGLDYHKCKYRLNNGMRPKEVFRGKK